MGLVQTYDICRAPAGALQISRVRRWREREEEGEGRKGGKGWERRKKEKGRGKGELEKGGGLEDGERGRRRVRGVFIIPCKGILITQPHHAHV